MKQEAQVSLGRRLLAHLDDPRASLAGEPVHNDLSAYTSPARFEREQAVLFRQLPLVLGFSSQLREPGAFVTHNDTGVPVLLVRGYDGEARAFVNVCRHRCAIVVEAAEGVCGQNFACPYHGWVYDTQGRLRAIPDGAFGFAGLPLGEHGLVPLPTRERNGLIWVLPDPDAELDLADYLGELDAELAGYGFERYEHFQTTPVPCAMNWKLVSDGFWEAYHLKVLHRQTIDPYFLPLTATFDPFGRHHRMAVARPSIRELEAQPEAEWDLLPHTAILYNLFPNTVFVVQGDHIEITRIFPGSRVDECIVYFSLFAPEPWRTESARTHWQRNMDLLLATVQQEDFRVGRGIQRAAAAGVLRHQVVGGYEPSLVHFHRSVRAALENGHAG